MELGLTLGSCVCLYCRLYYLKERLDLIHLQNPSFSAGLAWCESSGCLMCELMST